MADQTVNVTVVVAGGDHELELLLIFFKGFEIIHGLGKDAFLWRYFMAGIAC